KRNANRHWVGVGTKIARPLLALAPCEQLRNIGRDVALKQIGAMQLAEQLDQLVLGRRIVTKVPVGELPQLLDRMLPVHQGDDEARRRREAMDPGGRRVLQQIPDLATINMSMKARMGTQ